MQYESVRVDLSSDSPGMVLRLQHLPTEGITRRFNSARNTYFFFVNGGGASTYFQLQCFLI